MSKEKMIYNIANKLALTLLPKLAEEIYDYVKDNIDDAREYVAEAIKPDKVNNNPDTTKQSEAYQNYVNNPHRVRFTKPEIRWIIGNYRTFVDENCLVSGLTIDSKDDFRDYCNKKFNMDKTFHVYKEIARKGYDYYAYPDKLMDGEDYYNSVKVN